MKPITHPLDNVFNIEAAGSGQEMDIEQTYSMLESPPAAPPANAEPPKDFKDEDDIETDKKIDAVYDAAMETFHNQTAYTEMIEPRYAARNAEVAANFLSIALQAAATKAKTKNDRKRANAPFVPYGHSKTTNNVIVADRNDILKMITVDQDSKELP